MKRTILRITKNDFPASVIDAMVGDRVYWNKCTNSNNLHRQKDDVCIFRTGTSDNFKEVGEVHTTGECWDGEIQEKYYN